MFGSKKKREEREQMVDYYKRHFYDSYIDPNHVDLKMIRITPDNRFALDPDDCLPDQMMNRTFLVLFDKIVNREWYEIYSDIGSDNVLYFEEYRKRMMGVEYETSPQVVHDAICHFLGREVNGPFWLITSTRDINPNIDFNQTDEEKEGSKYYFDNTTLYYWDWEQDTLPYMLTVEGGLAQIPGIKQILAYTDEELRREEPPESKLNYLGVREAKVSSLGTDLTNISNERMELVHPKDAVQFNLARILLYQLVDASRWHDNTPFLSVRNSLVFPNSKQRVLGGYIELTMDMNMIDIPIHCIDIQVKKITTEGVTIDPLALVSLDELGRHFNLMDDRGCCLKLYVPQSVDDLEAYDWAKIVGLMKQSLYDQLENIAIDVTPGSMPAVDNDYWADRPNEEINGVNICPAFIVDLVYTYSYKGLIITATLCIKTPFGHKVYTTFQLNQ